MHRASIERHLNDIWYGRQPVPVTLDWLSTLHAWWARRRTPPPVSEGSVPVIVVGNLVAGGAGKTPVVRALGDALRQAGHRVVVVARGYGARPRHARPRWVDEHTRPSAVGDEPCMLAQMAGLEVVVCADRARAVAAAIDAGANVVISDDGLQNQGLARSHSVCVVDGIRGFGNERLLPAGPLREPINRLTEFDQVVVKGGEFVPDVAHTRFELRPEALTQLATGERVAMDAWLDRSVLGVCGIAHPEGFQATLEALGMAVRLVAFPDHHRYQPSDLTGLPTDAPIVVTEKDAVKIRALALPSTTLERVFVLSVSAALEPCVLSSVLAHVQRIKHHD